MAVQGSVDLVLIARAQLGDLVALDQVLALIQEPLFTHVSFIVGDEDVAADVLQDVLLTISRKLRSLRDPRWFRAWAYRIATRAAIRQTRRSRRLRAVDPDELANFPVDESASLFDPEELARVREAIGDLPAAAQVVIRMHYLDGLTQVEIAEALEISVGTVKSRISYGLTALRKATGAAR